jgi:ParB-like chromosome segregation protein Spo0J
MPISELEKSIKEQGQLNAVTLLRGYGNQKHSILDGKRRIKALKKMKRKTVDAVFMGEDNPPKRIPIANIKGV